MQIPVTNTGKVDGTEIVQVYVRNPQDPNGPIMQLRAFDRVGVMAGRSNTAEIILNRKTFEWFDEETNTVKTKPGTYEVLYGNSSAAEALQTVKIDVK
jgi:beta-glucosidase